MVARNIENIVIHESDTPNGRPQTVQDIDQWHKERGFRRGGSAIAAFNPSLKSIGYHYVIYVDGSLHTGRAENEVPAAVQGYNSTSINICMIGRGKYSPAQWDTLKDLTEKLRKKYPWARVKGHYQFNTANGKTCPDFDVPAWTERGMVADAGNILVAKA